MKKFTAIIILLLISSTSFGLDTNSIKYMPLHVGDYWVYNSGTWNISGSNYWISKCSVTSSIVYNNHLYYYLYSSNVNLLNGYFRTDSLTGSLYQYDPNNSCVYYYYEKLFDSLSASNGDSIKNCSPYQYKCTGIVPTGIFGDSTYKINFYDSYQGSNSGHTTTKVFVKKYGLYSLGGSAWGGGGFGGWGNTLKGCKINGIRYGDTSLTSSINTISSTIPASFILNQNYPNPFNPSTKINFSIVSVNWKKVSLPLAVHKY